MKSFARLVAPALLALPIWNPSVSLAADTTQACINASEEAQKLRDERKLKRSREQLIVCARETCPAIIRRDCIQWLSEVDASLSSVVVGARVCGKDVFTARVSIDGLLVSDQLDGKSILVDPGPHRVKVETEGKKPWEEAVLVKEGQKNLGISASFDDACTEPAAVRVDSGEKGTFPLLPVLLGGVGIAALGVGIYLDATGYGALQDLRSECKDPTTGKGTCTQQHVDDVTDPAKRKMLVGEILVGVGVVSLGVGTILLLTSGPSKDKKASRTLTPDFAPRSGGGIAGVRGEF